MMGFTKEEIKNQMKITAFNKRYSVEIFRLAENNHGYEYIAGWLNRRAAEKGIKLSGKITKAMVNHFISANKGCVCQPQSVILMRSQWTRKGLEALSV